MPPQLSLIVPYHDHPDRLSRLLGSIAAQRLGDIEVIVSGAGLGGACRDAAAAWTDKGLRIRLVEGPEGQDPVTTLLAGVEATLAPAIGVARAGGFFCGEDALEHPLQLLRKADADIVQYNVLRPASGQAGGGAPVPDSFRVAVPEAGEAWTWARPLAEELLGEAIFARYVAEDFRAHGLCAKLVSRSLWMTCLEEARRYGAYSAGLAGNGGPAAAADLPLTSLLLFHARRYRGSDRIGYAAAEEDAALASPPGEPLMLSAMLHEYMPHIVHNECSLATAEACSRILQRRLFASTAAQYAAWSGDPASFDARLAEAGGCENEKILVRAFLEGHPYMRLAREAREKKMRRVRLLRALHTHAQRAMLMVACPAGGRRPFSGLLRGLFRPGRG